MATTKKPKRKKAPRARRARGPTCDIAISERMNALDDAAKAAVESVSKHTSFSDAIGTVMTGLMLSAADIAWHATDATEEAFIELARTAFQQTAEAHAHCERAKSDATQSTERRDLH